MFFGSSICSINLLNRKSRFLDTICFDSSSLRGSSLSLWFRVFGKTTSKFCKLTGAISVSGYILDAPGIGLRYLVRPSGVTFLTSWGTPWNFTLWMTLSSAFSIAVFSPKIKTNASFSLHFKAPIIFWVSSPLIPYAGNSSLCISPFTNVSEYFSIPALIA